MENENTVYIINHDEEFRSEQVEFYDDWKHFGTEGSDDEWDQIINHTTSTL